MNCAAAWVGQRRQAQTVPIGNCVIAVNKQETIVLQLDGINKLFEVE